MKKPQILIFDVNETLLDMHPLKRSINKALDNELAFDIWFPTLLQYSLVETITSAYNDFSAVAAATFKMIAKKFDKDFSKSEISEILRPIEQLQPHKEVVQALNLLKENGFKLVALTNGKPEIANSQLKYARIDHLFNDIFSVEEVKKFKPHAETYHYILKEYKAEASQAMLIAAHGWDITGGARAGLQTAFIKREGKSLYPLSPKPDIVGNNLSDVANSLINQ